jgi:hypothetical protein
MKTNLHYKNFLEFYSAHFIISQAGNLHFWWQTQVANSGSNYAKHNKCSIMFVHVRPRISEINVQFFLELIFELIITE